MATITYAASLTSLKNYAVEHGFNDKAVLAKIDKLIAQKATKSTSGKKTQARIANERLANELVQLMNQKGVKEIRAAWVRENLYGVATGPKAVAILNAATDMGLLNKHTVEKSATRKEFVFTLAEDTADENQKIHRIPTNRGDSPFFFYF